MRFFNKKIIPAFFILFFSVAVFATTTNTETIVIVRHAEKQAVGLGQLTCQGLNRSLMLPNFFKKNFSPANYIFASNPADKVAETDNNNALYYFVRPLATIEPTAIQLNLPVNVSTGYTQINKFVSIVLNKKYHDSTIYVAWGHTQIIEIANVLIKKFNSKIVVPGWSDKDYNKVFVLTIHWDSKPASLDFKVMSEGFENISSVCPR